MPQYTSHIYAQPTSNLLSFLHPHPILSPGLFHIRQLAPDDTKDIARNGLPEEGLVVIREVCDPTKPRDSHDEAQTHEDRGAPIISWWDLSGPQDVHIILPENIPTLAFGNILTNHQTNLPPPIEFLRFLKHLSATFKALLAFYHHYTAYEDRLADCEYAWIFGQRDSVYIRHVNEPYKVVLYTTDREPQVVYDRFSDDQPILFSVLQEFDITLLPSSYRTYFHDFKWNSYKA